MLTKKATSAERVNINETVYFALRTAKFLENKLKSSFEYVEPVFENYTSYSLLSREIILQSCIQIEAVAKEFLEVYLQETKRFSWKNFFSVVTDINDVQLQNICINFLPLKSAPNSDYMGICLKPWILKNGKRFEKDKLVMPKWWNIEGGYNRIKHKGNKDISFCTYQNAIISLAGLYAIIIFAKEYTGAKISVDSSFEPELFGGTRIKFLFKS